MTNKIATAARGLIWWYETGFFEVVYLNLMLNLLCKLGFGYAIIYLGISADFRTLNHVLKTDFGDYKIIG